MTRRALHGEPGHRTAVAACSPAMVSGSSSWSIRRPWQRERTSSHQDGSEHDAQSGAPSSAGLGRLSGNVATTADLGWVWRQVGARCRTPERRLVASRGHEVLGRAKSPWGQGATPPPDTELNPHEIPESAGQGLRNLVVVRVAAVASGRRYDFAGRVPVGQVVRWFCSRAAHAASHERRRSSAGGSTRVRPASPGAHGFL